MKKKNLKESFRDWFSLNRDRNGLLQKPTSNAFKSSAPLNFYHANFSFELERNRILLLGIFSFAGFLFACSPSLNDLIRKEKNEEAKARILESQEWNRSNDCDSPLELAAETGNLELVRFLLENKADPNHRQTGCAKESILTIDGMYISKEEFFTSSHTPISFAKNLEVAKILIEFGANVNWGGYRQNDPKGIGPAFSEPPLLRAVFHRNYDLAKFLMEKGASTRILNSLTGENEFELWFTSVGIRNKSDRKFYEFLKSKGLKKLEIPSTSSKSTKGTAPAEFFPKERAYIHVPTGTEFKTTPLFSEWEEWYQTDLVLHPSQKKYFHSSEYIWKDTKQSVYEWILEKRIRSKKDHLLN
ncbi:ankyrin repeat domain-containing protein [Leptospira kmetyi]|uniref:ankyrin repeat domain-containing protein n=1 Tax=Leptospira kmetyi TaxID=408139 RepID=UPI0002883D3E|nr:ankyrin repeat domain-containing protein [Leptospira kmetyi]